MLTWRHLLILSLVMGSGNKNIQADSSALIQTYPAWKSDIEKARSKVDSGDFLEGREIYEQLIQRAHKKKLPVELLRREYEDLNVRLLFSKIQTPESKWYEVQEGDTIARIAKKNKTTAELIRKSNRLRKDVVYPGMKLKVMGKPFSIEVDKSDNGLVLYLGEKAIRHYPVATGKGHKTPAGKFTIITKLKNPTWYKPDGQVIPPNSPHNGLGTRWLGFDKPGYGIHGTIEPRLIGRHVSAGCVRMLNRDVEELYTLVAEDTRVTIKE